MLLIFDLDGTLIDSRRDLATGINLMRAHYGLPPLPVETVTGYIGDGIRKLVARSLGNFTADLDEAVRLNARFYRAHIHDETVLYPGVAEGLPALAAAGHTLALTSNKPVEACRIILRHFGLADVFAAVLGGDSTPQLKPDPEPLLQAMRRVDAGPDGTWMIGDNHTDIEAASRADVRSIYVTYGFGALGQAVPTLTLAAFSEVVGFFMANNPG